jgi:hypothetical protein
MKGAEQGAIFVWCNANLHYPQSLARGIDRPDLEIISPGMLDDRRLQGTDRQVVVDHATQLQSWQWDVLDFHHQRRRARQQS